MTIRILASNQTPGHRHTHEIKIIDDGQEGITVMPVTEVTESELKQMVAEAIRDVLPPKQEHEHGTPPDDFRAHHTDTTHPNAGEREFETGSDEYWKHMSALQAGNDKRTYDETGRTYLEYQDQALAGRKSLEARLAQIALMADQSFTAFQNRQGEVQSMNTRAMTNALTADHLSTMQSIKHADMAADRQWNNAFRFQAFRAADEHAAGDPHSHSGSQNSPEEQLS